MHVGTYDEMDDHTQGLTMKRPSALSYEHEFEGLILRVMNDLEATGPWESSRINRCGVVQGGVDATQCLRSGSRDEGEHGTADVEANSKCDGSGTPPWGPGDDVDASGASTSASRVCKTRLC